MFTTIALSLPFIILGGCATTGELAQSVLSRNRHSIRQIKRKIPLNPGLDRHNVQAISISNQKHDVLAWDGRIDNGLKLTGAKLRLT